MDTPVALFKALADDTRLRIMLLLRAEGELCVCEMTAALDQSQPKISRHLAQLRNVGLITDSRQGQWVYYRISQDLPAWAAASLEQLLLGNAEYCRADQARLAVMGDRPTRQAAICCP